MLSVSNNFFVIWGLFWLSSCIITTCSSATVFWAYYAKRNVTYARWTYKTNPKFPPVNKVRAEIVQFLKGLTAASLCPAIAAYLLKQGVGRGYLDMGQYGTWYEVLCFIVVLVASDLYEFYYHRLGHIYPVFWQHHRQHHKFHNPTPFGVIADSCVDQLVRSAPILVVPLLCPVSLELMFLVYGVFFYLYGIYLHCGFEVEWCGAHNPLYVNTAYHHNLHHSVSSAGTPYHTGFFIQLWDRACGSMYDSSNCTCFTCRMDKGQRTIDEFSKVNIVDYSPLMSIRYWLLGC